MAEKVYGKQGGGAYHFKHDLVDDIIAYENGEMTPTEARKFLLKNKSTLEKLQGHYGRAIHHIENEEKHEEKREHEFESESIIGTHGITGTGI